MMTIEHLIAIHYIKYFLEEFPQVLGNMAFFIDGPLALFGQPAWLHSSIMKFINGMNDKLNKLGLLKPTIIGLQKSGQVVDFTNLIANYIPNDTIAPVTDEYRYKYILQNRDQASKTFGYETYYGQDFIYKTKSGKIFVFGVPYPFADKNPVEAFNESKSNAQNYPEISSVASLISSLETELYKNAVIPIALAHKYTAISLFPGGKVLDILTKAYLDKSSD